MKYIVSILSALTLLVVFAAYKNATPPDPDLFAKGWVEMIKKKNSEQYMATYSLNAADINWLLATVKDDPYADDEFKMEWEYRLKDTSIIQEVNEEVAGSYGRIMRWADNEAIDVSALEFIRFYYDMQYQRRGPFFVLDDAVLYVKHKDDYYAIDMDEVVYVNGKWVMGRIQNITRSTQYLRENRELDGYMMDTTMMYGADTTMVVPEYAYAIDSTAILPEPMTKKGRKIQTKIGKYYQKIYKLEEELYSGK